MRHWLRLAALVAVVLVATTVSDAARAQSEPADNNIKGALYDLDKAEQQIKGLTPDRKANIKRLQRQLGLTQERLAASPNKEHPSWIEANQRLEAATFALDQLAGGGQAGAGGTAPAQPSAQAPAATSPGAPPAGDPTLARIQKELDMLAPQVGRLNPGDHGIAGRPLSETLRIGQELEAYPDRSAPAWREAVTRYLELNNHLAAVMAPSWQANLMSTAEYVGRMTPLDYMDPGKVGDVRQRMNGLYGQLQAFRNPENPAIAETTQALVQAAQVFEQRVEQAGQQLAALGDYAGELAAIDQRVRSFRRPEPLTVPADRATAEAYATGLAASERQIDADLSYLASIDGRAPLTVEQGNAFRNARSTLSYAKTNDIPRALEQSTFGIDAWVTDSERLVDQLAEIDPNDRSDQANWLLGEGRFDETMERLNQGLEAVEVATAYDAALGRTDGPDRAAQKRKFEQGIEDFVGKRRLALANIRMPEPASEDPDLLAAAAEVLARPNHGYDYARMVINYDVQRKDQAVGTVSHGAATSTITVNDYVWDEFQATTAEKVGDDWYLFVNEFHFYHSADPTVTTGKWILHDRFQSSQILEENIGG